MLMGNTFKKLAGLFLGLPLLAAFFMQALDLADLITECIKASYIPVEYFGYKVFFTLVFLALLLIPAKILFSEKMSGFSYGTVIAVIFTVMMGAVIFDIFNDNALYDFKRVDYPSYIEQEPSKSIRSDIDCDYLENETIYLQGYFDFLSGGFRQNAVVEVVESATFNTSLRVEIRYKGDEGKMYLSDYGIIDDYGNNAISRHVSIWSADYNYEPDNADYVYMYKNKENYVYGDKLAVEKIIVYTAYPDKINTDGIESYR